MKEFSIGQQVIHLREGLSRIVDKKTMGEREFFVVDVYRGKGETIYVPVVGAESIIRDLLNVEEADELLRSLKGIEKEFNTNTKQRRDAYKRRLNSGSVYDMGYMYRQYYLYEQNPDGVKLGPADIDMLEYATHYILDELRLVYNIDKESIREFLINRINSL